MFTNKRFYVAVLIVLGVLLVLFATARATDYDAFCKAACHEMRPYHQAWQAGAHRDIQCVECHVDQGVVPRLLQKWVSLRELRVHVFGESLFPMKSTSEIPNDRCIRCHEKVVSDDTSFSHATHAKRGSCEWCHATAAHTVTPAALKAAGVYSGLPISGSVESSGVAAPDKGTANIVGHREIGCTRCHDMQKTAVQVAMKLPQRINLGPSV